MKELLNVANRENFAVPAFNIGTGQILKAVLECSQELRAPVIFAIHPLELEFQGDFFMESVKAAANTASIPAVIHLDHGETIENIYRAIRTGFTSVMIDASHKSFNENAAITKKVADICHPLNISVEGELGTIGTTDADTEGGTDDIIYTKPEDVVKFVGETGVDCLAIAIGTAHGLYPKGFVPKLKLDLLKEIKKVATVPLVLHGGSGNPDSEIEESVNLGINKINISSDTKDALYQHLRTILAADSKVREPFALYPQSIDVMKEVIRHKIRLFHADGKAEKYSM
jgi:fructose-bisphosphate aldolase class II